MFWMLYYTDIYLSHQMQALEFVFLRETLTNLPKELNLWERHDIGEREFM